MFIPEFANRGQGVADDGLNDGDCRLNPGLNRGPGRLGHSHNRGPVLIPKRLNRGQRGLNQILHERDDRLRLLLNPAPVVFPGVSQECHDGDDRADGQQNRPQGRDDADNGRHDQATQHADQDDQNILPRDELRRGLDNRRDEFNDGRFDLVEFFHEARQDVVTEINQPGQ